MCFCGKPDSFVLFSLRCLFSRIFLFTTSQVSLCLLLVSFFNKAKLAAVIGPLVVFGMVIPSFIYTGQSGQENLAARTGVCLFSPTAFAFGASLLAEAEGANQGLVFSNAVDGTLSFADILLILLFDILLYAALALYFENVLPSEYGTNLHPLFFFSRSYWFGTTADRNDEV